MKPKNLHDHYIATQSLFFIGFIIMLSAILFQNTDFFWIPWVLGFLIMIACVLYAIKYLKCPHCGAKLDPRRKVPNFCPNCGKELNQFSDVLP